MGRGRNKAKNALKMQSIIWLRREYERLTAENNALKGDPTSVIGKFINEFNDVVNQNQRLSSLACAMIAKFGEDNSVTTGEGEAAVTVTKRRVEITRDAIEVFRGKRLQVQIETPDGVEKFDEADKYFFSYNALTPEEVKAAQEAAIAAGKVPAASHEQIPAEGSNENQAQTTPETQVENPPSPEDTTATEATAEVS